MPNPPPYSVDYYQVNAGTGDCEILLLLQNDTSDPPAQTIKKAVLIDGGEPTTYFLMNVKKTFSKIQTTYKQPQLQFDAVVITHWDEDHYGGILELVSQNVDSSGQVPWLKYSDGQPESILYIPYRFQPPRGNFTYEEVPHKGLFLRLENEEKSVRLCKVISGTKERSPKSLPQPSTYDGDGSVLIGRELFNNFYENPGDANSPAALVDKYRLKLKGQPGLFCVAANYQFLNPGTSFAPQEDTDKSLTNRSSIICLVIWPDAQITHYLAGDAPVALEEGVMQWTGMGASQSDKSQVHVVKASNHGARTSFPLTLCQKFKPSYILCSAGKGHEYPNWEFMFKVYSSMATNWDMMNCRIFFTNFPYYLRDGYKGGFKVDAKSLEEGAFYESFSSALKKYDSKTDPVKWVRSVLAQIILPQFARINDDFPPMEAANAHDDIQFIVIQSPAGDRPWSARVERLTSKRWAVTSKSSATVASKSSATVASKSSATVDAPLYTALSSPSYATPPGHAALATPDIVFYVTSSSVAVPPGPYAKVDAKWDAFIGALSSGYLVLSSKPPTTLAEVKLEMNDDFINVDQWLLWLTNLLHGEVDLSVLASLNDPNPVAIGCFKLSVTLQIGKDPISLTFNPSVTVGPDLGQKFDPYKHFLHFCLPESKPSTITLSDLFSFYNISEEAVWFKSDLAFDLVTDHCAVWLSAMLGSYSGTFRLEASTKANLSEFSDSLKEMGLWNVIPKSITVVVKRSIARFEFEDGGHPDAVSQLGFALEFEDFKAIMFCSSESYLIAFRWQKGAEDALENILKTKASGYKPGSFKDILGKISSFDILGASVEIKKKSPSGFEVARIIVDVEITFTYGSGSGSNNKGASFLLTFAYPQFLFRASLYTTDGTGEIWRKDMPDYEPLLEVTPTRKPNENISILELFPDLDNSALPHSIPHEIKQATFQIDDSTISFSGTLESKSVGTGDIPTISFDTLELDASCCLAAHPSWSLSIAVTVRLHPGHGAGFSRSNADEGTGVLYASVDYDSTTGKWKLSGGLSNIKFSDLLMFFHEKERDQVEEILGSISIPSIFLSYEYEKGMPSRFQFDGSIAIGKIEMQLKYVRDKDGWQVDATLTASAQYTLMDLLVEICGRTIEEELPDFFEEISLTPETMHLTCAKNSKSPPNSALVTSFDVMYKVGDIGKLSFTLVQISYPKERSGMKRRRLLSLGFTDLLPSLKMNVPLFGSLNNPIDGLELFWVNNLGGPSTASGLTREQIMEINGGIGTPIRFKETKASQSPKDVLITAGCHFMLLVNDSGTAQVALDYTFSGKDKKKSFTDGLAPAVAPPPPSPPSQSKAAVNKTVGPLSVMNIGLQYDHGTLFVVLDASLSLGPISLGLLGFGFGVHLDSSLFNDPKVEVKLSGLAAGLNKPPLSLDGLFRVVKPNPPPGGVAAETNPSLDDLSKEEDVIYSGGVVISIIPYGILAFGSYGIIQGHKTFFIFGQLEGPLVELGFATINGVKLGFGYNSHLTYPTVDNVLTFPLVQGIAPEVAQTAENSSNVLTILESFDKWIHPQPDSLWFAAGLQVEAFKALDVDAVAVIEVDPDISLALFARVVFSFPPKGRSFVYAELGIACRVIIKEGLFTAEASLSPNSYVLDPSCRLSGGLAICYWFEPSPFAGDFVFSIGGYHPSYNAPSSYPKPQRLAIAWRLSDNIHIEGNAYFAITPKVCMGGGKLDLRFSAGGLYAYFTAHADFFIVWSPFYFIADMGVSVGAGYRGKWWFVNVDISVDVSAKLHLEGPPFSGIVQIDIGITVIDVHFGHAPGPPPALSLDDFWELLLSSPGNGPGESDKAGITLAIESGNLPGENHKVTADSTNQSWAVTPGGFSFLVQCRFAMQEVIYDKTRVIPKQGRDIYEVFSRPMHSTQSITSTLTITVTRDKQTEDGDEVVEFTCKPIWKKVPSAQWGKYSEDEDPTQGKSSSYLRDGTKSTIDMVMGAHVTGPGPTWSEDGIPAYNVVDAMCEDVLDPNPKPTSELKARPVLRENKTLDEAKKAWLGQSKDTVRSFTDQWKNTFGWKAKLVGDQPDHLLDNLNDFYLYIPMST